MVEEGEAEALTARPTQPYTRALMAAAFDLRTAARGGRGHVNETLRRRRRPRPELERLRDLLDADKVKLGVHIRKMNTPGTPVYRAVENVVPAAAILVTSFAGTVLVHWYLGAAILAVGCWWWLTKYMPKVKDGVFDRTAAMVLSDQAHFDFWWARGVLSLYAKLPDGEERAAIRRNDWRDWVRDLPDDLDAPARRDEHGTRRRPPDGRRAAGHQARQPGHVARRAAGRGPDAWRSASGPRPATAEEIEAAVIWGAQYLQEMRRFPEARADRLHGRGRGSPDAAARAAARRAGGAAEGHDAHPGHGGMGAAERAALPPPGPGVPGAAGARRCGRSCRPRSPRSAASASSASARSAAPRRGSARISASPSWAGRAARRRWTGIETFHGAARPGRHAGAHRHPGLPAAADAGDARA